MNRSPDLPSFFHYSPREGNLKHLRLSSRQNRAKLTKSDRTRVVPFRSVISCWMDLEVMTGEEALSLRSVLEHLLSDNSSRSLCLSFSCLACGQAVSLWSYCSSSSLTYGWNLSVCRPSHPEPWAILPEPIPHSYSRRPGQSLHCCTHTLVI